MFRGSRAWKKGGVICFVCKCHETRKRELLKLYRTFLPFVKDGWTGVILALFVRVSELFAAALADTFLRHCDGYGAGGCWELTRPVF